VEKEELSKNDKDYKFDKEVSSSYVAYINELDQDKRTPRMLAFTKAKGPSRDLNLK
jgi:hypothetical protein